MPPVSMAAAIIWSMILAGTTAGRGLRGSCAGLVVQHRDEGSRSQQLSTPDKAAHSGEVDPFKPAYLLWIGRLADLLGVAPQVHVNLCADDPW